MQKSQLAWQKLMFVADHRCDVTGLVGNGSVGNTVLWLGMEGREVNRKAVRNRQGWNRAGRQKTKTMESLPSHSTICHQEPVAKPYK